MYACGYPSLTQTAVTLEEVQQFPRLKIQGDVRGAHKIARSHKWHDRDGSSKNAIWKRMIEAARDQQRLAVEYYVNQFLRHFYRPEYERERKEGEKEEGGTQRGR